MKKENYKKIANSVVDLEIQALRKLKKSINNWHGDSCRCNCKMSYQETIFMWGR